MSGTAASRYYAEWHRSNARWVNCYENSIEAKRQSDVLYHSLLKYMYEDISTCASCSFIEEIIYSVQIATPLICRVAAFDVCHKIICDDNKGDCACGRTSYKESENLWMIKNYRIGEQNCLRNMYNEACRISKNRQETQRTHTYSSEQSISASGPFDVAVTNSGVSGEVIMANARREAERIKSEIISAANAEAEQIKLAAEEKAREIVENASSDMDRRAEEIVDKLIAEKLHLFFCESRDRSVLEETADAANVVMQQTKDKREIVDKAYDMQYSINEELDKTKETLNRLIAGVQSLKGTMSSEIDCWGREIFNRDVKDIAFFYQAFARTVSSMEDELVKGLAKGDNVEKLQEFCQLLEVNRKMLVRALQSLGLIVSVPQAGEEFDSFKHAVEDNVDDDEYNGRRIKRCTLPGVVTNRGGMEVTVVRANVVLEP